MTEITGPLLDRRGIERFAEQELGVRVPLSTINKLSMQGRGPVPSRFYGRRQLYDRDHVRQWVLSLTSAAPRAVGTDAPAHPKDDTDQPEPLDAA